MQYTFTLTGKGESSMENGGKPGHSVAEGASTGGAVTDIRVEFERKCRIS